MSAKTTKMIIIRTMLKLVRRKKFSNITVTEICEQAEINRRTFYRYYVDKQDLLRDVYVECFFSKLDIEESDDFWDIFGKICEQIYSDKDFFRHAFEVKEQNGFWHEARALFAPIYKREAQPEIINQDIRDFLIDTDMDRLFHMIEKWINEGLKQSAREFVNTIKVSFYISGTWTAQLAAGVERTVFPNDIYLDFEGYLNRLK